MTMLQKKRPHQLMTQKDATASRTATTTTAASASRRLYNQRTKAMFLVRVAFVSFVSMTIAWMQQQHHQSSSSFFTGIVVVDALAPASISSTSSSAPIPSSSSFLARRHVWNVPGTRMANLSKKMTPSTTARFFKDLNDDEISASTSTSSLVRDDVDIRSDVHDTVVLAERIRREWMDRSVQYYSKVSREERRKRIGQIRDAHTPTYQTAFTHLAKKHYFALRKIKDGKPNHAETIYRRIINELLTEQEQDEEVDGGGHTHSCDHSKLAVTTLLLALLLQRQKNTKAARSVFLHFFRVAVVESGVADESTDRHQCACSAKVLQAYALFEMKQGNSQKSLQLVTKAVELDPSLRPVLNWKQFRDVLERKTTTTTAASASTSTFSNNNDGNN